MTQLTNPTNEQELRELFVKHGYPKMTQAELELIPAILDWHTNAEFEAFLNEHADDIRIAYRVMEQVS